MTRVPSPADIQLAQTIASSKIPDGSKVACEVPSSRSFLRVLGVPFLTKDLPALTPDDARRSLSSSVYADHIQLAAPPRIVRDSKTSDTCTIFFDIWDSQTGSRMKAFVGRSVNIRGAACVFRPARVNVGVPFCQRCCLWGHSQDKCNSPRVVCPICMGPHREESHRSFAACCKGAPKANPPVPPTADGVSCPHPPRCINCGRSHAANSPKCQFWHHRFDRGWILEHLARARALLPGLRVTQLTGETGTLRKKSVPAQARVGVGARAGG
jgi:hypothetical protein